MASKILDLLDQLEDALPDLRDAFAAEEEGEDEEMPMDEEMPFPEEDDGAELPEEEGAEGLPFDMDMPPPPKKKKGANPFAK